MTGNSVNHAIDAAGNQPAVGETMTNSSTNQSKQSFWQKHRMPIILGIIAVLLYAGSIVWMVYGRGQVG